MSTRAESYDRSRVTLSFPAFSHFLPQQVGHLGQIVNYIHHPLPLLLFIGSVKCPCICMPYFLHPHHSSWTTDPRVCVSACLGPHNTTPTINTSFFDRFLPLILGRSLWRGQRAERGSFTARWSGRARRYYGWSFKKLPSCTQTPTVCVHFNRK